MSADPLLMVTAPGLLVLAERIGDGAERVVLRNGVKATGPQIKKAGEILRDGPQPVVYGLQDDMPGFIDKAKQTGKSLTLQVGILPSRTYRIDSIGRAKLV